MAKIITVVFIIGILVGGLIAGAIGYRYHRDTVDSISTELERSRDANRLLTEYNSELTAKNSELGERIGELTVQLRDATLRHTAELNRIKESLGAVASELARTGDTVRDVIAGLEKIKVLLRSL